MMHRLQTHTHTRALVKSSAIMLAALTILGCGGKDKDEEKASATITFAGVPDASVEMRPGAVTDKRITVKSSDDSEITLAMDGTSAGKGSFSSDESTWSETLNIKSGSSFYYRAPGMGGAFTVKATAGKGSATTIIKVKDSQVVGMMANALAGNSTSSYDSAGHVQLANGKVLIFGGGGYLSPVNTIFEYDPMADRGFGACIKKTATLIQARKNFTATLLKDGKVLICGGKGILNSDIMAGAELYDPDNNKVEALPNLNSPRAHHTATLLLNGKVLIVGGENGSQYSDYGSTSVKTAELYDPEAKTFTPTAEPADARSRHTATLLPKSDALPEGGVLIAGGRKYINYAKISVHATAEIYDVQSGTFKTAGSMSNARVYHCAVALPDGKVLMAGGISADEKATNSMEIFDPEKREFTEGPAIQVARAHFGAVLHHEKVLLVGGYTGTYGGAKTIEEYDPKTGAVRSVGELSSDDVTTQLPWVTAHGPIQDDYKNGRVLIFTANSNHVRSFLP